MESICVHAPNLEFLRIVFEMALFWPELGDRTLKAIQKCTKLLTLAISCSSTMSSQAFCELLTCSRIHTLDLHSVPSEGFGILSQAFLAELLFCKHHIKVLNLTGQVNLSSKLIIKYLKDPKSAELESLSLGQITLDPAVLPCFSLFHLSLKRLSIMDCELPLELIINWLNHSPFSNQIKLYSNAEHPLSCTEDEWFLGEDLDIYSMWSNVVTRKQTPGKLSMP